jgi:hypothetical protein
MQSDGRFAAAADAQRWHQDNRSWILTNSEKNNDVLELFFKELIAVEDHHRSLVIITYGYIELFLNSIIDAKCKHGKKRITKKQPRFPSFSEADFA